MKQELSNGKLYIESNNSDDYIDLSIKTLSLKHINQVIKTEKNT